MGCPPKLTRQDEKRLKILAAAEETFLEKGFRATLLVKQASARRIYITFMRIKRRLRCQFRKRWLKRPSRF